MQAGYLVVETNPALPGIVRVRGAATPPSFDSPDVRFCARFTDIDAALMHFHAGLRRRLIDADNKLYRSDVRDAVAVAGAIELSHRTVYMAPSLSDDPQLARLIERLHARHAAVDRTFNAIGIFALILLVAMTLLAL
ncbi:MAG: hypothetical protein K9L70_02675 [Thiohalocapsa sp.]|jgi:hypothetical protein|nr:hypothetical protein [Thiohalocapsa sp.]MCF7988992.1 hypothetical protein [Thiohalocapsa sp.]